MNELHQNYLSNFLKYLSVLGYQSSTSYKKAVKELLERLEEKGKLLTELTKSDLEQHYDYLQKRPNYRTGGALSVYTIKGYWFGLQLFFTYLEKTDQLPINPMSGLSYSFPSLSTRKALSKAQIQSLYEVCESHQDEALLALFYGCGLRRSEAANLQLRDIDFRRQLLYVRRGKGKKRRVIPLTPKLVSDLKKYGYEERPQQISKWTKTKDHKAYMLNKIGTAISGYRYWDHFKQMVKRTDLPKNTSLHHLRHSIATHLLEEGMELERVRDFLGHDFLETTQHYTHISNEQLKMKNEK